MTSINSSEDQHSSAVSRAQRQPDTVDVVTATSSSVTIPAGLVAATVPREADAGQEWLNRLPGLVAAACDRWDCVIDGPATHGEVALVVPVQYRRGGPC